QPRKRRRVPARVIFSEPLCPVPCRVCGSKRTTSGIQCARSSYACEKWTSIVEQLRRGVRAGRNAMSKTVTVGLSLAMGLAIGVAGGSRLINAPAEAQTATTPASFSAVPGAIGEQDISGPYEVQQGWPKDLATLPGHEKWTFGGAR